MIATIPPTTTLADVLLMHGIEGCLTPPLRTMYAPASPLVGRAITVELAPGAAEGGFDELYSILSGDLRGGVLVIAGVAAVPGAVWGQILSRAAARRGAVAAIVDGAVRDVELLAGERVAVYAASLHTAGAPAHAHVSATRGAVRVGDTPIDDGDLIVADSAGAVRLPRAHADTLLAHGNALAIAEERVLEDLASGRQLVDCYHHKRTAQADIRADLLGHGSSSR